MPSFSQTLSRGFFWRLFLYGSAFILNLVIARTYGAGASGRVFYIINNLSYAIIILSAGFDGAISYFVARKEISRTKLFFVIVCWPIIAGNIFYIFCKLLLPQLPPAEKQMLFNYTIFVTANIGALFCSTILFALLKASAANFFLGISNLVMAAIVLITYDAYNVNQASLFLQFYSIIYFAIAIVLYILVFALPAFYFCETDIREPGLFIWYAAKTLSFTVLYALLLRFDYWLVKTFCSSAQLGTYIQTSKLNQLILFIPTVLSVTLLPLLTRNVKAEEDAASKVGKLMAIYFLSALFISITIIVTGYWLLPVLYGTDYKPMYTVFILLCPGLIALATAYPLSTYNSSRNRLAYNCTLIILSVIISCLADVLLIPRLNIHGAAAGSSIGYLFYFFMLYRHFKKEHPLQTGFVSELSLVKNPFQFLQNIINK